MDISTNRDDAEQNVGGATAVLPVTSSTADGVYIKGDEFITDGTFGVMMCKDISYSSFLLCVFVQAVQMSSYFVLAKSPGSVSVPIKDNYNALAEILVAFAFAALAVTANGYKFGYGLFRSIISMLASGHFSFMRIVMASFQMVNLSTLYCVSIIVIPLQGNPLSIILNCTALFAISELDTVLFTALKLEDGKNGRISTKNFDENKWIQSCMKILLWIFCFVLFVGFFSKYAVAVSNAN